MRLRQAIIDLSAIQHNFRQVKRLAPHSQVISMIKSDAYGHGMVDVARCLSDSDAFGVSVIEEALALREAGITQRIILMTGVLTLEEMQLCVANQIEIVVHQREHLELLRALDGEQVIAVWPKVDVAMHRLGFEPEDFAEVYEALTRIPAVKQPIVLMSHLPNADKIGDNSTHQHIEAFDRVVSAIQAPSSIAKSAGLLAWPQSLHDWVRPGIMLYGISPLPGQTGAQLQLKPAMSLHAKVVAVRHLRAGDPVSYGGIWRCPEDMTVAIVGIGYSDGYPRHAKNGTTVLVEGHRCQIVGRVCMDMLTVDCRNYPAVKLGDHVTLWGDGLPIEWVAEAADTIAYELICRVSNRVKVIQ